MSNLLDEEYEKSLLFDAALESEPHYVVVRLIKTYVLSVLVDLDECGLDPADDDEIIRTARDIAATDTSFGNNVDVIDVQTDFAEIEED